MFGSSVVTGRVRSDTSITCMSPPYTSMEGVEVGGGGGGVIAVSISVSLNGIDFFTDGCMTTSNNNQWIDSLTSEMNSLSQVVYEYVIEPSVTSITPFHGPVGGGTVIDVSGIGFIKDFIYHCNFRGTGRTQASRIDNYLLRCITPEFNNISATPFHISYDSSTLSLDMTSSAVFQVDPPVTIHSLSPSQISSAPSQNSMLTVR